MDPDKPLAAASSEFYKLFSDDMQQGKANYPRVCVPRVMTLMMGPISPALMCWSSAAEPEMTFHKKLRGDKINHSICVPCRQRRYASHRVLHHPAQRLTTTVGDGAAEQSQAEMAEGGLGEQDEPPCWKSDKLSLGLNPF